MTRTDPLKPVRLARPADAGGIAALVRSCYGDRYAVPEATDPKRVAESIRAGREQFAIADGPRGPVGMLALTRKAPALFEVYRCVVDPVCRGRGIMRALTELLEAWARDQGGRFVMTGLVTSHPYAQRSLFPLGYRPLGLLVGKIPATAAASSDAEHPVSVAMFGRPLQPLPPRRLRLPANAAAWSIEVARGVGLTLQPQAERAHRSLPGWGLDEISAFGVVHLRYSRSLTNHDVDPSPMWSDRPDTRVAWVDLPVEDSATPALYRQLNAQGFALGAYLPLAGPDGEDVLRLQRYQAPEPVSLESIRVVPELEGLRREVFEACFSREAARV